MFILPLATVSAQQDSFSFMSFDIGYGMNFNMASDNVGSLQSFGINFRVADPIIIGGVFRRTSDGTAAVAGQHTSTMLRVMYDIMPMLRGVLSFGQHSIGTGTGVLYTGLGFEAVPFRRQVGGLVTEFKMVTEYLFRPDTSLPAAQQGGIENGTLIFGLVLGIGF